MQYVVLFTSTVVEQIDRCLWLHASVWGKGVGINMIDVHHNVMCSAVVFSDENDDTMNTRSRVQAPQRLTFYVYCILCSAKLVMHIYSHLSSVVVSMFL